MGHQKSVVLTPHLCTWPDTCRIRHGPPGVCIGRDEVVTIRYAADKRTLPLHVAPLPGEALDSWLEAVAHRHDTPFGTLLQRLEIHHQTLCSDWMLMPEQRRFEHLARATGVETATLAAMTLTRYDGLGMALGGLGQRSRPTAWGWKAMSRFCSQCLRDTAGRWQIAWRLNWSFACTEHHRLLIDVCPECAGLQRSRTHPTRRVPRPGHCALSRRDVSAGAWIPCHADLTSVPTPTLAATHPILEAQRRIDDLLVRRPVDLPLYGRSQPHPREVLRDVMLIARWAAGHAPANEHDTVRQEDSVRVAAGRRKTRSDQRLRGNPSAAEVAAGVTTAIGVLNAPDVFTAVRLLRQLVTSARGAAVPAASSLSPFVRSAYDHARRLACDT